MHFCAAKRLRLKGSFQETVPGNTKLRPLILLLLWLLGFYSQQGPGAAGVLSSAAGHKSSSPGKAAGMS